MRALLAIVVLAACAAAGGALFLFSGIYDVAATDQHRRPVYWLLETAMRQSVRHHARDVVVPPLTDPAMIARGRGLHDRHCVRCHGAPGVAPEAFALGMLPVPANLAHTAREWEPADLFWVIKHGLKMTGMPAWEYRLVDGDVWAVVAYLRILPRQAPRDYGAPASSSAARSADDGQAHGVPRAPDSRRGQSAIQQYGCPTCHEIPGIVGAVAPVGPPLAHMASRPYIAGLLTNNAENMARWIRSPQQVHRDSAMPDLGVTESDARDIAAYLSTLR